jgi:O-antigen ligase
MHTLRNLFCRHFWLAPALLVLAGFAGRGVFNTLFYLYALWGLIVLAASIRGFARDDGRWLSLHGLLLAAFLLALPWAVDGSGGLRAWATFLFYSLCGPLTLLALRQNGGDVARLARLLGLLAGVFVVTLYLHLAHVSSLPDYTPTLHLKEDNLPFVFPFLALWLWWRLPHRWRVWGITVAALAVLAYLLAAKGRAALFGWLVALVATGLLVWRLPWRGVLAGLLAVIALALLVSGEALLQGALDQDGLWARLDAFTSLRTQLWRQALAHPPENIWIGVGIGNAQHHAEVMTIGDGARMRGLHNFLFDVWYETGLLGLATLCALIGHVYLRTYRAWPTMPAERRTLAGTFTAASLAVLATALLSFSYTSRYFAPHLFLCLGVLAYLSGRQAAGVDASRW